MAEGKFKIKLSKHESEQILEKLNREHTEARDNQRPAREKWQLVEKYVHGWQLRDRNTGALMNHLEASAPSDTENIDDEHTIVNEIRRIHLSNVQRMSAYDINPEVVPDSKSPDNKKAARMGQIALADMFRRNNIDRIKKRAARIMTMYGTAFFKITFDPSKGRQISKPSLTPFGNLFLEDESYPEGEIVIDVVSPRNMLAPRNTVEVGKADWLEEVQIETTDYIYRQFGVTVEAENVIVDEDVEDIDSEQRDVELDRKRGHVPNTVILKSRFYRPSPKYKRGAIFIYTKKKLLWSSTLLDFYPDIPYFTAEMTFDDRSMFGEGLLWDLIPMQDAANEVVTAMRKHVNMYGDLQLMVPAEAQLKEGDFTNATGRHMVYQGQVKPDFVRPPELSATHFNVHGIFRDLLQDMSAAHDISRRKGTLSGNAIAFLQEIDDTVMRPALKSLEQAYQQVSSFGLELMDRFYDTNRLIKMYNFQGWMVEDAFRGELLKGNFHAQISLMTGLPSNKMARLEFLRGLKQDGAISDMEFKAHLEFGTSNEALEQIQKANEIADDVVTRLIDYPDNYIPENVKNEQTGQVEKKEKANVIPHVWDDHELIVKKMLWNMRESYDRWEEPVKEAFEEHLKFHQDILAAKAEPLPPGAGPVGAEIDPGAALPGLMAGPDGSQLPPGQIGESAGAPSVHSSGEQPDRGAMPARTVQ